MRSPYALLKAAVATAANAFRSQFIMRLFPAGGSMQERGLLQQLRTYQDNPWIRANLGKIARTYSSVRWYVVKPAKDKGKAMLLEARGLDGDARARLVRKAMLQGEAEEVYGHPATLLMQKPVPYYFTGSTARRLGLVYRMLAGESFQLMDRMAMRGAKGNGLPAQLWPIPPHWVIRRPAPGYPSFLVSWNGYSQEVPMEDMLWNLADPNIEDPYTRGIGMGKSIADELSADESSARMLAYRFHNMGRPDMIVSMEGAKPDEIEEARLDWNRRTRGVQGFMRSVFTSRKTEVKTLTQSFEDMKVLDLRRFSKDLFRQVFGLPPEIMGDISNSNRSTIDAADFHFTKHVILPELEHDREFLQVYLMPEYGDGALLEFENPVAEDREFQLKAMQAKSEVYTVDEWREMGGHEPLEGGAGKVFLIGYSTTVVEELEPAEPAPIPPALDPNAPPELPAAEDDPSAEPAPAEDEPAAEE